MISLVFFVEERSAKEILCGVLPKILPDEIDWHCRVFEGKQDLEKRLPKQLRDWQKRGTLFIVLRDQDRGDCKEIKARLKKHANSLANRML